MEGSDSDIEFQQSNANLWNLTANKISALDPFRSVLWPNHSQIYPTQV